MNINQDILDEILSRLPVKSLVRFEVVCKNWYSNIKSPNFIAKHLKNQTTKKKILLYHHQRSCYGNLVFSICSDEDYDDAYDSDDDDDDDVDSLTLYHQYDNLQDFKKHLPLVDHWKHNPVHIIGTCNGLVLFDYNEGKFDSNIPNRFLILWNPATRDFKALPKFQPLVPPGDLNCDYDDDYIGFGFDRPNNDYKVIRILYFAKKVHCCSRKPKEYIVKMGIYSLSTNSWREFDCSGFSTEIIGPSTKSGAIFGEEKFCWLAAGDSSRKEEMILSFDMGKEVFQKTPLPSDCVHAEGEDCDTFTMLYTLHDSIALILHSARGDMERTSEIWTTKELEQEGNSWIKMSEVICYPGRRYGLWKFENSNNPLYLFSQHPDGIKGVYMDKRDQIKTIKVKNDSIGNGIHLRVFTYIETLVSVKNDKSSQRFV